MVDFQFDGVFNHSEAFLERNEVNQGFRESSFARVCSAADEYGLPVLDGLRELICNFARQSAGEDELVESEPLRPELPNIESNAAERCRREHDRYARTVRQARIK